MVQGPQMLLRWLVSPNSRSVVSHLSRGCLTGTTDSQRRFSFWVQDHPVSSEMMLSLNLCGADIKQSGIHLP